MTYAFSFDARYCSGCKACQAACKDKNNLPTGVLWRRVYEVSGGSWQQEGEAWVNNVFAYNLSMSCNHCAYPKCAGVCPTGAYNHREDGIVFLDSTKCVGCGYCAWACPYGAPQYNTDAGYMTKCDLCMDQLEQGNPPACVAACPLRVLEYGTMESVPKGIPLWNTNSALHPHPMPAYSHTQPHLALIPHPAMSRTEARSLANLEEVQPRRPSAWEDLPLVLFTLLVQLAVGGFWVMTWVFPTFRLMPNLMIGISLGIGMLASFAHLGTKKNAWRALNHLRKSSLSREILFTMLFGLSWLVTAFQGMLLGHTSFEWMAVTVIFGVGLIHSMSQVYRFPAAPGWNSWRTNAGFFVSAGLLGISSMKFILAYESTITSNPIPSGQLTIMTGCIFVLFIAQFLLMRGQVALNTLQSLRVACIVFGIVICGMSLLTWNFPAIWLSAVLLFIVLAEEGIGRWIFYASRLLHPMAR